MYEPPVSHIKQDMLPRAVMSKSTPSARGPLCSQVSCSRAGKQDMFSRTFLTIAEHAVDWAALMPRDASVREDVVTAADQSPFTCKRRRDTGIVRQDLEPRFRMQHEVIL